ncbi:MAG: hypothetical protein CO012_02295 [Syntrophobacterales bacterium CG_4_8_14_3_um_filter_49_14]|nr:MAG: hypothetical protein COX52_00555 [Syntrophobacterales bacterium CG23_combo_of_CG06-09_8_20_14_all_48_27]PJA50659.1 MAG: hypothetical protein CO171_00485 [Syntrophobacterales bacterium CG_4_9_14_3_um_filter_49_8]PJC75762.1 MAG: hypothetical protein CO012_02295 [Syntrophobacterales bacterium CG_4_8_14_3_um_filter_49_14]
MSKGKFTSKEFLSQLRTCPPLAYDFSIGEVLGEVKRFLEYVGYEVAEPPPARTHTVTPDFYARRKGSETTYEIAGIVRHDMEAAVLGIAPLDTIKDSLGEEVDYAIALPPVNERYLIDFMCEENYRWFKKIEKERYMIWLCNPAEKSVWSILGAPRDKLFREYFKFRGGLGMLFNMPYRRESKEIQKEVLEE